MLLTGVREMTMIFKVKKQQITSAVVGLSLFCCRYLENDSFRGVPLMKNISDECSILFMASYVLKVRIFQNSIRFQTIFLIFDLDLPHDALYSRSVKKPTFL